MALGRRKPRENSLWVSAESLQRSPGHPFYLALEKLLKEAGFDRFVEELCEPFYHTSKGRPSIPPGVYFRMLFVGFFEGIESQRGIAWRCADSNSIRDFLGLPVDKKSPDHSSLTVIRKRLSLDVHMEVFRFVVDLAAKKKLLKGKTLAVDATLLEANAAMKSIVRRDTGEDWKEYVRRLAEDEGMEDPSDDDLRRFDKKRKGKKVGNDDWESKSDPDSRIMRMKDGRTHLSYKAEHALDLESEIIVAATITHGTTSDPDSLVETLSEAQAMYEIVDCDNVEELVADRGYHDGPTLAACEELGIRTYVPEPKYKGRRIWTNKTEKEKAAVLANRVRNKRPKGKRLQRQRSERVERSFAHTCGSGGARRTQLRGLEDVRKRYAMHVTGRNLGRILFLLLGVGTPRSLHGAAWARSAAGRALGVITRSLEAAWRPIRCTTAVIGHVIGAIGGQRPMAVAA